jgi:hypothetical protein
MMARVEAAALSGSIFVLTSLESQTSWTTSTYSTQKYTWQFDTSSSATEPIADGGCE